MVKGKSGKSPSVKGVLLSGIQTRTTCTTEKSNLRNAEAPREGALQSFRMCLQKHITRERDRGRESKVQVRNGLEGGTFGVKSSRSRQRKRRDAKMQSTSSGRDEHWRIPRRRKQLVLAEATRPTCQLAASSCKPRGPVVLGWVAMSHGFIRCLADLPLFSD